jgi:hypothetical protein
MCSNNEDILRLYIYSIHRITIVTGAKLLETYFFRRKKLEIKSCNKLYKKFQSYLCSPLRLSHKKMLYSMLIYEFRNQL